MIRLKDISKTFATSRFFRTKSSPLTALHNITLDVPQGCCLGVMGENGAGKTTLLKIIATLLWPDRGTATIQGFHLGKDNCAIRSHIGFVLADERSFYGRLTGRQNLEFFAALCHVRGDSFSKTIDALSRIFKMDDLQKRYDSYSAGTKRKLALIRALIHDPQILLLDEPTKSLDHETSSALRQLILQQKRKNRTILLATHDFEEAEVLCDRFLFLHSGRVMGLGTLAQLNETLGLKNANVRNVSFSLERKRADA